MAKQMRLRICFRPDPQYLVALIDSGCPHPTSDCKGVVVFRLLEVGEFGAEGFKAFDDPIARFEESGREFHGVCRACHRKVYISEVGGAEEVTKRTKLYIDEQLVTRGSLAHGHK